MIQTKHKRSDFLTYMVKVGFCYMEYPNLVHPMLQEDTTGLRTPTVLLLSLGL
jgi:hypothetical protein